MSYKNRTHSQRAGEGLAHAVSALIGGVAVCAIFGAAGAVATDADPVTDTKRLACSVQEISCPVRLEGHVLWTNSSGTSLVLQDDAGTVEVEMDLRRQPPFEIHDRIRIKGMGAVGPGTLKESLINNDGLHGAFERNSKAFLRAGRYPIKVGWFNALGALELAVEYEGPELPRQKIPDSALFREPAGKGDNGASEQGLSYRCYEGRWDWLPVFGRLAPAKSGTVRNFDLGVRTRDQEVGIEFAGYLEIPRDGVYTFWTKSDDGSRLKLGGSTLELERVPSTGAAATHRVAATHGLESRHESQWTEVEGFVTSIRPTETGELDLELDVAGQKIPVRVNELTARQPSFLDRIRATGICICSPGSPPDSSRRLIVPSLEQVDILAQANGRVSLLLTNVAQLAGLGAISGTRTNCLIHLEGTVLASVAGPGPLAFQDDSGTALLESDLPDLSLEAGQRIIVEGSCLVEGTRLFLRNRALVENDGVHAMAGQAGSAFFEKGKHPIRLYWFNRDAVYGLEVYYEGPGLPRCRIPDSALFQRERAGASGAESWTNGLAYRCFEGRWLRVPEANRIYAAKAGTARNFDTSVATRREDVALEFTGYVDLPCAGTYTFSTISDDGSVLFIDEVPARIEVIGTNAVPPARPLATGHILQNGTEQWSSVEGIVSFASEHGKELELEIASGAGRTRVEIADSLGVSPVFLLNSRVRARGIAKPTSTSDGQTTAGTLLTRSLMEIDLLDVPPARWELVPLMPVRKVSEMVGREDGSRFARVRGKILTNNAGALVVADETGQVLIQPSTPLQAAVVGEAEVLGRCERKGTNTALATAIVREIPGAVRDTPQGLGTLTSVEQIKSLGREEAQRGYPVKIRGVITAVLVGGFFIQDATWSIYARAGNPLNTDFAQIGDYWEVEGTTFAEFAPNIQVRRAIRLGPGTLPEPLRPAWDQLINGSFDTQYIEAQGVVTGEDAGDMILLTRSGKIKLQLEGVQPQTLRQYENALIRVRGCVIPGRNPETQQVELGRLHLANASISVDRPAPADLFIIGMKRASDLLLFDPLAGALERVKLSGQILHERANQYYLANGGNGLRVFLKTLARFPTGAQVEVVGFPELGGPSPILREAVMRQTGQASLPKPRSISGEALLSGDYDATLVRVNAQLTSVTIERLDQVLVMQSGTRGFVARLKSADGLLRNLLPGSRLELTGVYAGQGGDRPLGRGIDSFELLLNSPGDVRVLARPSWWTAQHTLGVVGAMATVIVAGLIWIRLLRSQVEERSRQLRAEIRSHEQTEGQRELEAERARIARDLHDDLGATLTQIRLLSALQSRDPQVPEISRGRMKQVSEKSREMVASLDEIVWAVNPANDSLPSLATYLCQFAEEFFRATPIRCRLDVDDGLPPASLTSEVRHHLYLVVREALNNIAKHSQATEVWLRIQWREGIYVGIEDNGQGFIPSSVVAGEGLANMRTRLEKIGGRFECDAHPGAGAVCRIQLPLAAPQTPLKA